MGSPARSMSVVVVMIADRIMAGVQSGLDLFTIAATPATWAAATEVPESRKKPVFVVCDAETMLTPGASTSGLRIPPLTALGPREENPATAGARCAW
ncbi:unnamed protein product [Spirodela intermedia]|uniref:Uncharacterized protein n=1 Tax=Spirodela intermedia TaxID=51605 RepID=A0A7I8KJ48_SPIIN|nr:unnamed protein product [Spirodela intermedia]